MADSVTNNVNTVEDNDENETEDIDETRMPKCKTCGRYTYGHSQPFGPKCRLIWLREDEIDAENEETLEKRRRTLEGRKRTQSQSRNDDLTP